MVVCACAVRAFAFVFVLARVFVLLFVPLFVLFVVFARVVVFVVLVCVRQSARACVARAVVVARAVFAARVFVVVVVCLCLCVCFSDHDPFLVLVHLRHLAPYHLAVVAVAVVCVHLVCPSLSPSPARAGSWLHAIHCLSSRQNLGEADLCVSQRPGCLVVELCAWRCCACCPSFKSETNTKV